jgi:RHS repeat-associated protein
MIINQYQTQLINECITQFIDEEINHDPVHTYYILSRVTSMTTPAGTTSYEYDRTTGNLSKITTPEGKEFNYRFNHGQLSGIDLPNGISALYTFDNNGNLSSLHYNKGGTPVKQYDYTYDKNQMRTSMTDNDGTHNYTYDPLYQILDATHPSVKNPLEQFSYDAAGNWLNDNRVHNELNQLLEDDSCYYRYDLDGNMTEKISKATIDTIHFVWDIENKLTEVRKPGLLVKYEYDAIGRRVSKEVNGVVTQFRYDGEDMILEMDSKDSLIANYTFGPGIDDPLMMHRDSNNYYYVKDGLGSVTALTDSTGNSVKEYKYGVFGIITDESGDSTLWNPFTYTSREWEKEIGIYFYRARYYDPEMGRFLSEDPIGFDGGDVNIFRYCLNSPTNHVDASGNSACMVSCVSKVVLKIGMSEMTFGVSDLLMGDFGGGFNTASGLADAQFDALGGKVGTEKYLNARFKQVMETENYTPIRVFSNKPEKLLNAGKFARRIKGISFLFDIIELIQGIKNCEKNCEKDKCNSK